MQQKHCNEETNGDGDALHPARRICKRNISLNKRIPRGEKTMQADFVKKHRKIAKKVEGETERQAGENAYAGHA